MKRKALLLLLSLALIFGMAIPGTLALASSADPDQLSTIEDKSSLPSSHEPTLYERLMACETLEKFYAIADELTEEEQLAFEESLAEDEIARLEAKLAALEPEPLPPVVIEESTDEPVESEIIYITKNVADVAPFLDPVVG